MKNIAITIAFLMLLGSASAGTVTLTGTCRNLNLTGNTIIFFLTSNSTSNDTAYSLILTPIIPNAQTVQSTYAVNSLAPGQTVTIAVRLAKVILPGVTPAHFILAYQQGTSVFTAVFPCLVPVKNITNSTVFVGVNQSRVSVSGGVAHVPVAVFNSGPVPQTVNVSLITPPTFNVSSPSKTVTVQPYRVIVLNFTLGFPAGSQAFYSAAATATYIKNNQSYASLLTFVIGANPGGSSSIFSSSIFDVVIAAVVLVIALILISILRKRPKGKPPIAAPAVGETPRSS